MSTVVSESELIPSWSTDIFLPSLLSAASIMSDNPSFVLRGVEDVIYEQRPIPEGTLACIRSPIYYRSYTYNTVADNEVLVEVKKTG